MPEIVARSLASHLAAWPAHPELGVVFTNVRSGPVQQYPFAQVFESARARAGLPDWATPHDLRHFYASTLIRSGASVKVIQTRLGHASAKTTLDVYGHLFPDEEDRTRTAVDAALQPDRDAAMSTGRDDPGPSDPDSCVTGVSEPALPAVKPLVKAYMS